ncbi:hypothetical protein TNCV_4971231 [Trichonephila clavipes]|nr:hypothetical protein TNCV_4971231 [Trichonephila clavipes]
MAFFVLHINPIDKIMINLSRDLGAQILRNQNSEQPPMEVITELTRMGIESSRDCMAFTGTDTYATSTRCYSSSIVVTDVC